VEVDRRQAWNGKKAKAYGARPQDAYVTLDGLAAGTHTVAVCPTC
jgi:hypothetical protein